MRARRSSKRSALCGVALIAAFAALAGCEILAGIKDKTLAGEGSGGGGGSGSSGTPGSGGGGSGMVSSGPGGGLGGGGPGGGGPGGGGPLPGDPVCGPGGLPDPGCADSLCGPTTDTESSVCNCGVCGHSCGGSTCKSGACVPMAMLSGIPFIYRVATNGTSVFFASGNDTDTASVLYRLPLDAKNLKATDAPAHAFGPTIQGTVGAIAADCSRVYFATQFLDAMGKVQVYELSLDGKKLDLLASVDVVVSNMVADGARAYWASGDISKGYVEMWDPATMKRTTLPQPPTFGLAVDATYLYWSLTGKDPQTSGIRRARISQLASAPAIEVVTKGGHPTAIAVDDAFVYWIELGGSTVSIFRAKKEGGGAAEPVGGITGAVESAIAVDATNVYWIEDNIVRKRSKKGDDSAVVLADRTPFGNTFQSYWLTTDRSRVYFADTSTDSSTVMWVAK